MFLHNRTSRGFILGALCLVVGGVGCTSRISDRFKPPAPPVVATPKPTPEFYIVTTTPTDVSPNTQTFKDTKFGVEISFPTEFKTEKKSSPDDIVTIAYPASYTVGTNLDYARIIVASTFPAKPEECLKDPLTDELLNVQVEHDGIPFYKWLESDAGAGHFGQYVGYVTHYKNGCYSVTLQTYAVNREMFEPDKQPNEFDHAKVVTQFEEIFKTFKITK